MATVSVRYIVDDVDQAIAFYTDVLGFELVMHPAEAFAMLTRGDLRLVLSKPGGGRGGGQAMPDGTLPTPGGWNRFSLEVDDLTALTAAPPARRPRLGGRRRRRQPAPRAASRRSSSGTKPADRYVATAASLAVGVQTIALDEPSSRSTWAAPRLIAVP
jgi:catechol 2,3-dioxygenase-like lactoylglutathione lyase family enzyme